MRKYHARFSKRKQSLYAFLANERKLIQINKKCWLMIMIYWEIDIVIYLEFFLTKSYNSPPSSSKYLVEANCPNPNTRCSAHC